MGKNKKLNKNVAMAKCDLCNISIPESHWNDHATGKRHAALLERRQCAIDKSGRSIFVSRFAEEVTELMLIDHFMQFAPVASIYWDKDKGKFAIVEFQRPEDVELVLSQTHCLANKVIFVQQQRPPVVKPKPQWKKYLEDLEDNFQELLSKGSVEEQMSFIVDRYALGDDQTLNRLNIHEELYKVLRKFFPQCHIHVYGSCASGLGMINSDVDLFLQLFPDSTPRLPNGWESNQAQMLNYLQGRLEYFRHSKDPEFVNLARQLSPRNKLQLLTRIIKKYLKDCQQVIPILSARCPIIQYRHAGTKCDISITKKLVIYNTRLLYVYQEADPRVRPLMFNIRFWAKHNKLCNSKNGRFSSYAISMLVVFYLQNCSPPILPSVETLLRLEGKTTILDDWECGICMDVSKWPKITNEQSLESLLIGFFHFYYTTNLMESVVCVRTGKLIPKSEFQQQIETDERLMSFKMSSIAMQDPFELTFNFTANLTDCAVVMWFDLMETGHQVCTNGLCPKKLAPEESWGLLELLELKFCPVLAASMGKLSNKTLKRMGKKPPKPPIVNIEPVDEPFDGRIESDEPFDGWIESDDPWVVEEPRPTRPQGDPVDAEVNPNQSAGEKRKWTADATETVEFDIVLDSSKAGFIADYETRISNIIHGIFRIALQFDCDDNDTYRPIPNDRDDDNEPARKKKKVDEFFVGGESPFIPPLLYMTCKVYYRTWYHRRKRKFSLKQLLPADYLAAEATVSGHIIAALQRKAQSRDVPREPIVEFTCAVLRKLQSPSPRVTVQLRYPNSSSEAKTLPQFLKNYIRKTVDKILRSPPSCESEISE